MTLEFFLLIAIILVTIFLFAPISYKLIISIFFLCNCFDFLPKEIHGIKLWDVGLFFLSATFLFSFFSNNKIQPSTMPWLVFFLKGFYLCILLSVLWSLVIYKYSVVSIVKCSRQMVFGYLLYFVFVRILVSNSKGLQQFIDRFYILVFVCTLLSVSQHITGIMIFSGYLRSFTEGAIRAIPIFLPFTVFYMLLFISRCLQSSAMKLNMYFFIAISFYAILMSLTRGLYISFVITIILYLVYFIGWQRIRLIRFFSLSYFVGVVLVALVIAGTFDLFISRWTSGISDISASMHNKRSEDNFTMRMGLLKERINMVYNYNPIVGFGFIHEDIAARTLKWRIGSSNLETQRIYFASADIGLANIIIYTGFLGLVFFILFIISGIIEFYRRPASIMQDNYIAVAAFFSFLYQIPLLLNSEAFTGHLEIPMFMLAAFTVSCPSASIERVYK